MSRPELRPTCMICGMRHSAIDCDSPAARKMRDLEQRVRELESENDALAKGVEQREIACNYNAGVVEVQAKRIQDLEAVREAAEWADEAVFMWFWWRVIVGRVDAPASNELAFIADMARSNLHKALAAAGSGKEG